MLIPDEQRFPNLKNKLDLFADATHAVIAKFPGFDRRERNLFTALVRPWLLPANVDPSIRKREEAAKEVPKRVGFDAEKMAAEIRTILENDRHLRECCGEPLPLAYILDELYVQPAIELLLQKATGQLEEQLFTTFNHIVYGQGPYTRIAYSHLFNFSSTVDKLDFSPLLIHRLSTEEVASVLGGPNMPSAYTFLQPPQVGTFFIVHEENGEVGDLFDWLWSSHVRANSLFRVVQYHKYGVAYVDYSTLYFRPSWVNHLRKFGLFYVGNARRLPYLNGTKPFELPEADFPAIRRKLSAYLSPTIVELMQDETAPFRQGSLRAGDYFEASLAEDRPAGRLIALAIALESLFSPSDGQEISFKTALAASQLLGSTSDERKRIFADLQDFYKRRSKLMHGSYDVKKVYEGTFVTHDDVDRWSSYIHESILRFLTLYFRGKRTKPELDDFRRDLLSCALDNAQAESLRVTTDLETFLDELQRIAKKED